MTASSTNYTLGSGVVSIAEIVDGVIGTYYDAGNAPKLDVALAEEVLEHHESRTNLRVQDLVITKSTKMTFQLDLEELTAENLNRWLKGTLNGATISALTGADKRYALKFVTNNAAGPNFTWEFFKVKLSAQGSLALIGEALVAMSFNGAVEQSADGKYLEVTGTTTTTTTSTTSTTTTTA